MTKVVLVVDRGGKLLCREAEKIGVPEVGEAFTIEDEGDPPEFSSTVEAVASGSKGRPLIYGGPWPHDPADKLLKRRGFRACRPEERERIEGELAKGPA
ncbi:MAG: hypothetical protein EHM90_01745 [Chloroflexi bacterium]|nr:MAG: hypothetical protein EHM90_01745 [Chloroflexota bacterium]